MEHFFSQRLMPAVTFERIGDALPLAETLLKAGLNVLEVPFRTGIAREAISRIRNEFPELYIGAGTILHTGQLQDAIDAGAQFALAPGLNPAIVQKAKTLGLPFIPGVMTPSEIEQAIGSGCRILKLFPMQQIGGISMLKALAGPYAHTGVRFIPMGGINHSNLQDYLAAPMVLAAGGSWLTTKTLIREQNWAQIEAGIRNALAVA